jgi:hypothetical protein
MELGKRIWGEMVGDLGLLKIRVFSKSKPLVFVPKTVSKFSRRRRRRKKKRRAQF